MGYYSRKVKASKDYKKVMQKSKERLEETNS
jgi:hypothetical protein